MAKMEHAKKMILVEPRVLQSLQTRDGGPPVKDATSHSLTEMDKTMQDILESDENVHDKAEAYQQALRRYLNRFDQYKDRPLGKVQLVTQENKPKEQEDTPERQVDSVEQDVLQSVPKSMKSKAERLLQRLKEHPDVEWNSIGELTYQGENVKKSNLTDLVNDVLRQRRRAAAPLGWDTFAKILQRINVPQDLVGNPDRWSYIRKGDTPATSSTVKPRNIAAKKQRSQWETPRKWKKERNVDWVSF